MTIEAAHPEATTARDLLEPPPFLRCPLEARVRFFEDGELDAATWRDEADHWAALADSRYRACTELRRVDAVDPPIRVGVKDTVDVAGYATRLGLRRYRHYPVRSARVLGQLQPGLVNAKLTTSELSLGLEHGCVNPFFPHLDPAGSSTGCAVAVAAHISDVAMGTDTTVSLRHPAAACGVVALRMTHDVRLLEGVFPLSPLLDAPGWVARTADDLRFVWERLLGGRPNPIALRGGGDRYRIGVVREALDEVEEPVVREAMDRVCDALAAAGHPLVVVSLGRLWRDRGATYRLCARTAWDAYGQHLAGFADTFTDSTLRAFEVGAEIDDATHRELLATVESCRRSARARFAHDGVDAWLLPVADFMPRDLFEEEPPPSTLKRPDQLEDDRHVSYATIASLVGLPAITFPAALDEGRRAPVALQAIGRRGAESTLIGLAETIGALVGDLGFGLSTYAEPKEAG